MTGEDSGRTTPKRWFLKEVLPLAVLWGVWFVVRVTFPDTSPWLLLGGLVAVYAAVVVTVLLVRRKRRGTPGG